MEYTLFSSIWVHVWLYGSYWLMYVCIIPIHFELPHNSCSTLACAVDCIEMHIKDVNLSESVETGLSSFIAVCITEDI